MGSSIKLGGPELRRKSIENRDVLYVMLTRFNVSMNVAAMKPRHQTPALQAAWLRERVAVFWELCLPSMLAQTIKPHAWVIMFDKEVTHSVAQLLDDLLDHDWIVPMLFGENWTSELVPYLRETLQRKFDLSQFADLCTIRLDSDDSLHRHYVAAVDAAISARRDEWDNHAPRCLNFPYGCRQTVEGVFACVERNTFFALVESIDGFRTCYRENHTRIDRVAEVYEVFTREPMFLYNTHGANAGRVGSRGLVRFADTELVRSMFGLTADSTTLTPGR